MGIIMIKRTLENVRIAAGQEVAGTPGGICPGTLCGILHQQNDPGGGYPPGQLLHVLPGQGGSVPLPDGGVRTAAHRSAGGAAGAAARGYFRCLSGAL